MREVMQVLKEKKVELEEDVVDLEADLEKARGRLALINEIIEEVMENAGSAIDINLNNGLGGIHP